VWVRDEPKFRIPRAASASGRADRPKLGNFSLLFLVPPAGHTRRGPVPRLSRPASTCAIADNLPGPSLVSWLRSPSLHRPPSSQPRNCTSAPGVFSDSRRAMILRQGPRQRTLIAPINPVRFPIAEVGDGAPRSPTSPLQRCFKRLCGRGGCNHGEGRGTSKENSSAAAIDVIIDHQRPGRSSPLSVFLPPLPIFVMGGAYPRTVADPGRASAFGRAIGAWAYTS